LHINKITLRILVCHYVTLLTILCWVYTDY